MTEMFTIIHAVPLPLKLVHKRLKCSQHPFCTSASETGSQMTEMFTTIHPVPQYCVPIHGRIQEIWIRGVECVLVYVCAHIDAASRGVWHAPPVKFFNFSSEIDSGALLGKKM